MRRIGLVLKLEKLGGKNTKKRLYGLKIIKNTKIHQNLKQDTKDISLLIKEEKLKKNILQIILKQGYQEI